MGPEIPALFTKTSTLEDDAAVFVIKKKADSAFSENTGSLSSDGVLTLLDDQYADIPATTMGDWGTESFEVSVEVKSADGTGNITSEGTSSGMLLDLIS